MNSLDVIKKNVVSHGLQNHFFEIVCHEAELNWRQNYTSFYQQIENVESAIAFDEYLPTKILGSELLSTSFTKKYTSLSKPLVSISSRVTNEKDEHFHFPMMNLHLYFPITSVKLKETIDRIYTSEYFIVRTDRFYHVYGTTLLSEKQWLEWNCKFLMIDGLISPRYIGHSIQRGFNLLRLNNTISIKKELPTVVSSIESDEKVRLFAIIKHGTQKRRSGELYFLHVLEVETFAMEIIEELNMDLKEEKICDIRFAALLHDTIEDTYTDYEEIENLTNSHVAKMVSELSNDKRMPKEQRENKFLEQIKASPLSVQIVKLADIYSNLLGIKGTEDFQWILNFAIKCKAFLKVLKPVFTTTSHYKRSTELISTYSNNAL